MTFTDAIIKATKSGKRFRRKAHEQLGYPFIDLTMEPHQWDKNFFGWEDILADDWEIEEKKVEITESVLRDAIAHVNRICISKKVVAFPMSDSYTEMLLKDLGL